MSVAAKVLANAAFATASDASIYQAPANTRTIIDKFTVTNNDGSAVTLTVNIVPSGDAVANSNLIIKTLSVAAAATTDITSLQNQILAAGDFISVKASSADKLIVRVSGREVT